ncbi:MAG: serine/threonine protein kinase [bacterium]
MNLFRVFKKPEILKLWLKKAIPAYIFFIISILAINYVLPVYLKHKYPPIVREERLLGIFDVGKKVYISKWRTVYNKWTPYLYLISIGITTGWMLMLIRSAIDSADNLAIIEIEKADKAESENDLSKAIYNLKKAVSLTLNEEQIKGINNRIEALKSSLSTGSTVLNKTSTVHVQIDPNKTIVKQPVDNVDYIANRYKKLKKLGQGAMGIVWLAEDTVLERQIAVKELPVQLAEDTEFKERFFREAKLLAKLTHPNIVQLYDIVEDKDVLYYTMEYVDGIPLDRLYKSSKLSMSATMDYALQILKGMEYAHSMKIIHRDLKPMNIMVRKDNIVKIADFGLAKIIGSSSVTMAGTVMGSPMYMSPEQAMGEEVDERSDIYSFCMILYELITGAPAFTGAPKDVIVKQIQASPPKPSSLTDVPEWLEDVILKGLTKDKEQRYQHISDIINDIKEHWNPS